jgi:hypothetical protein
MEALNREVLTQDMHEQETQKEALLKQMEEMNKEVLSATEEKGNKRKRKKTVDQFCKTCLLSSNSRWRCAKGTCRCYV